jgi:hypothetical protein
MVNLILSFILIQYTYGMQYIFHIYMYRVVDHWYI